MFYLLIGNEIIMYQNYLFSNIVITQIMRSSPEVEKKMPYLNSDYSEYLVRVLGDKLQRKNLIGLSDLLGYIN